MLPQKGRACIAPAASERERRARVDSAGGSGVVDYAKEAAGAELGRPHQVFNRSYVAETEASRLACVVGLDLSQGSKPKLDSRINTLARLKP
jgi:hypothetical protein